MTEHSRAMAVAKHARCKALCAGAAPCILNGAVPHHLHICHREDCSCHSQARYEAARQQEAQVLARAWAQ